jgi:hypothetical protein
VVESGWVFACFPPEAVNLTVDSGLYQNNGGYGFEIFPGPAGTATLASTLGSITYGGNGAGDNNIDPTLTCNPPAPEEEKPVPPYNRVEVPDTGGTPTPSDCVDYSGTVLILPDGSQVKMACPADGNYLIERNTKDNLPGPLPLGPAFVDSVTISLDKDGQPVKVLTDGGYFLVSFVVPEAFQDKFLSVLYWDETANNGAGAWVEMPREQFLGQTFPLHPNNPDDGMTILRGVQQADNCVTLKVNFTGVFVLIAR